MKHMRKPTIPVAPWGIPEVDEKDWDFTPDEIAIEQARQDRPQDRAKKTTMHRISPAQSTSVGVLMGRTIMGQLNVSDLGYMAKALLQMSDEMHELRERVRILEGRKE